MQPGRYILKELPVLCDIALKMSLTGVDSGTFKTFALKLSSLHIFALKRASSEVCVAIPNQ